MTTRLKRAADLAAGGTPQVDDPAMWDALNGTPWVSIGDMTRSSTIVETDRRVSSLGAQVRRLPLGQPGTVLFAMYASVGEIGTLATEATWNQAIVGVSARDGRSDSRFIAYWLEHLRPTLSSLFRSNTQDNLNAEQVGNLPFPELSVDEQRRIADFLDAETVRLDSTLAVRDRQADLQLERWRSTVAAAVLNTGGDQMPLKRLFVESFAGIWGTEPGESDEDVPCARVADFDRENYCVVGVPTMRSVSSFDARRKSLRVGDILLEKSGGTAAKPVGCAVMYEGAPGAVCSNFIQVLRPRPEVLPRFVGYVMAALYETRANGAYVNQTTGIQNLDIGSYLSHRVSVPDVATQIAAVSRLDHARDRVASVRQALAQSARLLAERRQALITAAVTGQLDVTTARGVCA